MKQVFLIMTFVIAALTVNAQDADYYKDYHYYDGIEYNNTYGITADQRSRIAEIKRNAGYRFAEIGRDRTISGREKGERKRALSLQIRKEISDILDENQKQSWDNHVSNRTTSNSPSTSRSTLTDIENHIRAIERQIDKEEREYDRRADEIDDNYMLSKDERKAQKRRLKNEWKDRKQQLKDEKQRLKDLI